MKDPNFKVDKSGVSVALGTKKITIALENGIPTLNLTNEYGNSLAYSMSGNQFDSIHSELWRFVKESQH
jgi:hypothetical protein